MSIEQKMFGSLPDGTKIHLYTLTNTNGVRIQAMEYGARVVSIQVPDRKGNLGNVVLGHDTLEEYLADGDFLGAAVGRYANRIAGGKAEIDGTLYSLSQNENGNTLHGGFQGFHQKAWRLKCSNNDDEAPSITFAYRSADGEEGFPGNLDVSICYTLTTDNALVIDYTAKTDVSTLVNLTNHSFFNLTSDPARDILSHELQIHADFVTAAGEGLIPTGELVPVAGTPADFRKAKTVGQDIRANDPFLRQCNGYDHNFVLAGEPGRKKAAEVYDQSTGRVMLVFTDMPGMQLYTANGFSEGVCANGGVPLQAHHALCLETQFFPDSPHHANFPSAVLHPGEVYRHTTTYKFEVRK